MKNKEKDIRVKMFRVTGDYAPFVKVSYKDKNAEERSGLFLIDSCSSNNILIGEMMDSIGDNCKKEGDNGRVYTISGEYVSVEYVTFSFALGGDLFSEEFGINDVILPEMTGDLQIIGILGEQFLMKHHLVIDYSDFTIYTSEESKIDIADCDFFTPMEMGLKYYDLPLVHIYQNGKEILALADTGATNNLLASQTIIDNDFECQFLKSTDTITGLAGEMEVKEAIVNFNLLTLKENGVEILSHFDLFKVTPGYIYMLKEGMCDEEGELLPPIEGIICSPFMAKEGWILDFGVGIIYKLKAA